VLLNHGAKIARISVSAKQLIYEMPFAADAPESDVSLRQAQKKANPKRGPLQSYVY